MVGLFVYHTVQFQRSGVSVTWSDPPPLCSVLIFNPRRKYEVTENIRMISTLKPINCDIRYGATLPTAWCMLVTNTFSSMFY